MKKREPKPLPFKGSQGGMSEKALAAHHDKLYAGYIAKRNEIGEKLEQLLGGDLSGANQTYSELRGLKEGETFAVNGAYLHEGYFENLGGDGKAEGPLAEALAGRYGSLENFMKYFSACGLAARGWVVLCWDTSENDLKVYSCDAHNQGGVWGCMPLIILDVYEHAYFMDYGPDRKSYIEDYWKNLNWKVANKKFTALS